MSGVFRYVTALVVLILGLFFFFVADTTGEMATLGTIIVAFTFFGLTAAAVLEDNNQGEK